MSNGYSNAFEASTCHSKKSLPVISGFNLYGFGAFSTTTSSIYSSDFSSAYIFTFSSPLPMAVMGS